MNPHDRNDIIEIVILVAVAVVVVAVALMLAFYPGRVARRRGHPNAEAIRLCGVVGLFVWPAWVVAVIWAHTGADRSIEARRRAGVLATMDERPRINDEEMA